MYKVTTGPASEPLNVNEAKAFLRVEHSDDDALISTLISAARQWVERHCNLALLPQTVLQVWDKAQTDTGELRLALSPVQSVTAVTYLDTGGNTQTMDASAYRLDTISYPARLHRVHGVQWPAILDTINTASAVYIAGYEAASAVPAPIIQAMYLTIADMYDNRTDYIKKMPTAAEYLLQSAGYRIWEFQ